MGIYHRHTIHRPDLDCTIESTPYYRPIPNPVNRAHDPAPIPCNATAAGPRSLPYGSHDLELNGRQPSRITVGGGREDIAQRKRERSAFRSNSRLIHNQSPPESSFPFPCAPPLNAFTTTHTTTHPPPPPLPPLLPSSLTRFCRGL